MRRDAYVRRQLVSIPANDCVVCAPVAAEIEYGLACLQVGSRRLELLRREWDAVRTAVQWLDWDADAAAAFGVIKARLRSLGAPIQDMDVAIAACAMAIGAEVATCNARHFARIDGIVVLDWLAA